MTEGSGRFDASNDPVFKRPGICHMCKNQFANKITCRAFPEGIPEVVLFGDVLHVEPFPGDRGVLFEAIVP